MEAEMNIDIDEKPFTLKRAILHQLRYWFGSFDETSEEEPELNEDEYIDNDCPSSTCSPDRNRAEDAYWQSMANWMASQ